MFTREVAEPDRQSPARRTGFGSVRTRITAAAAAVVGGAVGAGAIGLLSVTRSALLAGVDETASLRAGEAATLVAAGHAERHLPVPVHAGEDDVLVQVVDGDGRVVAASPNALDHAPPGLDGLRRHGRRWLGTVRGLPIDPDDRFRVLAQRADSPAGPVTIFVATEMKVFDDTVAALRASLQVGAPALVVLVAGMVWVLVGRALRPVERIRSQVAEISAAALDRRVPEPAVNDEVGRLARTMNAMLDRLQASAERQQRFTADASHELRSPLASARAQLEVAAAHPETTTVEILAGELLTENQRMERLVGDLLFLARSEDGTRACPAREVDVDELVLAEVTRLRPDGRVRFELSGLSGGRTRGQAEELARVVRNLIENAVRHAATTVTITLRADDHGVELAVADDWCGIPPEDRDRVFDRFTRLDTARGRHQGGAGLGLAIVRDIVTAHGGDIRVEDPPGRSGGARFVVRLRSDG